MTALLYLAGLLAALAYGGAIVVLTRQGDLSSAFVAINPLWLLIAVVALGLGRLVTLAEAASVTLRQLDGWRTEAGSRIRVRGGTVMEVLGQIRDRLPPNADVGPNAASDPARR